VAVRTGPPTLATPAVAEEPYFDSGPGDGRPESLVLDIGGDVGALIVYATEGCLGREIDITAAGAPRSHHLHTMIRRRRAPAGQFVAGVYPELTAGTYTVWGLDGAPLTTVDIVGGRVAEHDAGDCRAHPAVVSGALASPAPGVDPSGRPSPSRY
jgi:hypothetical protein